MKRVVAINAQINPSGAGGVETYIRSLLEDLKADPRSLKYITLSLPRYADEMSVRIMSDSFENLSWEHGESAVASEVVPPRRIKSVYERLNPAFRRRVDSAIDFYRSKRYGQNSALPSPQTCDAALKAKGVSLIHFPTPGFFPTSIPFIYEPWDLQFRHYPEFFSAAELDRRERQYSLGCARARLIIVATQWVKDDIVKQFQIPPKKIAVVHRGSGFASPQLKEEEASKLLRDVKVPEQFIFFPAMTFPHKNHLRLFEALAVLRDQYQLRIPLVMSGRPHKPHQPVIEQALVRFGLKEDVYSLGAISEEMLSALFSRARFMVFPSLFEGLGLPLLEAFEHRLPVLAANETCIPEVVGDAAILFDGKSVQSIADSIRYAWQSPQELETLKDAGIARLKDFSWTIAGPTITACYKHILGVDLSDAERGLFQRAIGT